MGLRKFIESSEESFVDAVKFRGLDRPITLKVDAIEPHFAVGVKLDGHIIPAYFEL